jgi:hypothetical protein
MPLKNKSLTLPQVHHPSAIFSHHCHHIHIMTTFHAMHEKVSKADGFLAALDQSGGSTPKALKQYGIPDSVRSSTSSS